MAVLVATAAAALVVVPAASASFLWWTEDGNSFASVGPNASVTIDMGQFSVVGTCAEGIDDVFFPWTDIYIVQAGSVTLGATLTDAGGAKNTVMGASGGLFISETIAFTAPSGSLGDGTYAVVYDECQNGKFDAEDSVFDPALQVTIPETDIPPIDSNILAIKATAGAQADSWQDLIDKYKAIMLALDLYEKYQCLTDLAGCAIGMVTDYIVDQFKAMFGIKDVKEAAVNHVINTAAHYRGIEADPPDPAFAQVTTVETVEQLDAASSDALLGDSIALGNAAGNEQALAGALLHAIERYQGADAAGNGQWALIQARAIQRYAGELARQQQKTVDAIDDLYDEIVTDTRPLDTVAANVETIRARMGAEGLTEAERRYLRNRGLTDAEIGDIGADLAADDATAGFSELALRSRLAEVANATNDAVNDYVGLANAAADIFDHLQGQSIIPKEQPYASAGGPYTAAEGAPLALNGSASMDPDGTISAYDWDLDGDGSFDDATGATPSVTLNSAGIHVVGLRVTDNESKTGVDYAQATITAANAGPTVSTYDPVDLTPPMTAGDTLGFSLAATDPEGDPITVQWYVGNTAAGSGLAFSYSPTAADVGVRIVRAVVADGPTGGIVELEWSVSVLAGDGDGDGWHSNADCNDADAEINPGHREVAGNGIDDDCDPTTPDSGSGPTASFSVTPSPANANVAALFNDNSTDANEDIVSWAWTFGDGGTSDLEDPSHVYTAKGVYAVTLTVTDSQGHSDSETQNVTVVSPPLALFTYAPPSPVGGSTVEFTDASTDDGSITAWAWDFGDGAGSTEQNPSHTYLGPGTFAVSLTVTDDESGTDTLTQNVVVGVADPATAPVAAFKPDVPARNLASAPSGATVVSFSSYCCGGHEPWQMLDDSIVWPWATNGAGLGHFATIELTGVHTIDSVQVQPRPDCCADQRVRDFAVDVSTTGTAAADFTTVLTATAADNGLLQTFQLPVPAVARYVRYRPINNRGSCCYISTTRLTVLASRLGGRTVTFDNLSTNAVSYRWEFGDGGTSTDAEPTHTYAASGLYTVRLTARSADGRSSTTTLLYEASGPVAAIGVDPAAPVPGEPVTFSDLSTYGGSPATSWLWNLGDGTTHTGPNLLHTYAAAGTYTVTLTVTDKGGFADTATRTVTVADAAADALPVARFNPSSGMGNVASSAAGAAIQSVSGQYSAGFPATTAIDEDPNNSYWATPNLTPTNGWMKIDLAGGLSTIDRFQIAPRNGGERVRDFQVAVSTTGAADADFTTVLSATATNDDTLQTFALPAGTKARYVLVRLLNNRGSTCCIGVSQIKVLTRGAVDTGRNLALKEAGASITAYSSRFSDSHPVENMIDADPANLWWATANGQRTGWAKIALAGSAIRVIDRISLQPRNGGQRVQDFEVAVSTTGTADRDFVTVLRAKADNNDNLQQFALPHPVAAKYLLYRALTNRGDGCCVSTNALKAYTGQESGRTVVFDNLSSRGDSYLWDFGDGETSTAADPTHAYAADGTYTVTLTATNANGSTTYSLEQVVRSATFTWAPETPQVGQRVVFTDTTSVPGGIGSWTWDFGDGTSSTFQNPVKFFATAGTYTVTLRARDREGNELVTARVIVVDPIGELHAAFRPQGSMNVASLEAGAIVRGFSSQYDSSHTPQAMLDRFTDASALPWATGSGQMTNQWVKVELAGGPQLIDRVQVMPRPSFADQRVRAFEIAVSTTNLLDSDFITVLQGVAADNGNLQTFALPYPMLAKYVLYRPLNNRGNTCCISTQQVRVLSGGVGGPTVTFDNLSVNAVSYEWQFGDGSTSTLPAPTHTYTTSGTYIVTLTATDATGATATYSLPQRVLAAPEATFAFSPDAPGEMQVVNFVDTTTSTADATILDRRWTWNDGSAQSFEQDGGTTHAFPDNGTYNVTLEVTDSWGQTDSITRAVAVVNRVPTVAAGPDWRFYEDKPFDFTATTSDPAGARDPVTCSWSYGDGTPATPGCKFAHAYAEPGTYTATVTATDDDGGSSTDAVIVTVVTAPADTDDGGSGGGRGEVVASTDRVYTLDDDFDSGTLLNVNHNAPNSDELRLNTKAKPFPFLYVANSARGTAVRIDVDTGQIVGEFLTAPDGRPRNPSRTTVDKLGNVYVTNRDEAGHHTIDGVTGSWGSFARVGLIIGGTRSDASGNPSPAGGYLKPPFEYSTCVDRNADGLIRTSKGRGDILGWANAGGADHLGGVTQAVDECLINYTRVLGTNTRTVAIDSNNDAWVGGMNYWHEKIDGDTGQRVPGTAFSLNCGGYGGLIDGNDVLWSARNGNGLLRYDTKTRTGSCLGNGKGDYGLGVDPKNGHVWQTYLSWGSTGMVVKINPNGTEAGRFPHGQPNAQGVAVDSSDNVWVAHSLFSATTVGHLRTDGTFVGNVDLRGGNGPTGVAVDGKGRVWSANINTSTASRIVPDIGPIGGGGFPVGYTDLNVDLGSGAGPYNYSDMTGAVSVGAASPSGFWSIVQDGGAAGTRWTKISWNGSTPSGTEIEVEARSADAQAGLASETFEVVGNDADLDLTGRFVEVRANLRTSDRNATPVLQDIRITSVAAPTNDPPVAFFNPGATPGGNLALNTRGASIESVSSEFGSSFAAATLIDSSPTNSYWATANGQTSGQVVIALAGGGPHVVDRVRVMPGGGAEGVKDFAIDVSTTTADSAAFQTVLIGTTANSATLQEFALSEPQLGVTYVRYRPLNTHGSSCCVGTAQLKVLTGQEGGATVAFTGLGTDPDGDALTYDWDFGDGSAGSGEQSPTHTFPGTGVYDVTLTVTDPDGETDSLMLRQTVLAAPTADFVNAPVVGATGKPVVLSDRSTTPNGSIVAWSWNFGDGTTSNAPNPTKTWADAGTYDVTLEVTDEAGQTATVTKPVQVRLGWVTLQTGPGDGQLIIDVAGYGDFGYQLLPESVAPAGRGDARYDPLGSVGLGSTSWESSLQLRRSGLLTSYLSSARVGAITPQGELEIPSIAKTSDTRAVSSFDAGGLHFELEQRVEDLVTNGTRTGSVLVQTYEVTNTHAAVSDFELVRYYEGDLAFGLGAAVPDGGGHLLAGGQEFVFQTDRAGTPATNVDFVGVTATGGQPSAGRYEVGQWTGFPERIRQGLPLANAVFNDGPDADEFVDAGQDYDVGIALANRFLLLGPSESTTYVTKTYFGSGAPAEVVNEAPVASDAAVSTEEDAPVDVTLGATDTEGQPLTFEVVAQPAHGTLSGTAPNLTYTPDADYHGSDSFTFKANDGGLDSNVATVSITVTPVNDPPVAGDDSATTPEDTALVLEGSALRANDTDVDGDSLTVSAVGTAAHGTVELAGGQVTYTPAANYFGSDSFAYTVSDGNGGTDTGSVAITVTPVNDAPVGEDASVTTPEDTPVALPMTGSDLDGDALAVTVVEGPTHGTLVGGTYTPAANYFGPDSVRFRVSDGSDSDEAVVSITVSPVNDAPVATDAAVTTPEDTAVALTFAGSDVDGDALTSEVLEGPSHGALVGGTYMPAANYFGPDSVRFRVSDGSDSDDGVVSITVSPVNDLPVCLARSAETRQETAVDVAPSCTDVEDVAFSYQIVAQGSKGVASIVGGQLHYLPNAGATGADSFRYRGIDSEGGFGEAPVAITITPVQKPNDPPLCANASFSTLAGVALSNRVSCTDADGDALAYRLVSGPSTGSLVFRPDGTFTYTPASGFTGTTSFRFRAEDGQDGAAEAVASIAVTPAGDITPPSCGFSTQGTNSLGQKLIRVSVRDQGSGLASITVLQSVNVTIAMPTFAVGKRTTLLIWATQIDKTKPTIVEFAVADLAGNITTCDPVFTTLRITSTVRGTVKPHAQTFLGLPQNESKLVVRNKRPGLNRLDVIVNGRRYTLTLRPGQTRRLDFHKAMKPGRVNTITIRGHGRPGARADIVIADRWV